MSNSMNVPSAPVVRAGSAGEDTAVRADRLIRRTTTATVLFLAAIAGVVSYGHMHLLALRYGEERWTAALLPLSVDGMIVAASLTLLRDSRRGKPGGMLPWALLLIASGASLAANVAVAHPMIISRVIAAWPSFALIGAYEMLMRQIRNSIGGRQAIHEISSDWPTERQESDVRQLEPVSLFPAETERAARHAAVPPRCGHGHVSDDLRWQAWQWAVGHRSPTGELPTGKAIAEAFERSPRWGRLVKSAGLDAQFDRLPESQAA
jgi:hypothetical protein